MTASGPLGRICLLSRAVPLDPDSVQLEKGFSQDKRGAGHYGTGDLELTILGLDDLEKAEVLILRSFESV